MTNAVLETAPPSRRTPWNTEQPPKDRAIIIIGKLMYDDGAALHGEPVICLARWSENSGDWVYAHGDGLRIRTADDETLVIHHWIDRPGEPVRKNAPEDGIESAKRLVAVLRNVMGTNPTVAWHLGLGSQTYRALLNAACALLGTPRDELRAELCSVDVAKRDIPRLQLDGTLQEERGQRQHARDRGRDAEADYRLGRVKLLETILGIANEEEEGE